MCSLLTDYYTDLLLNKSQNCGQNVLLDVQMSLSAWTKAMVRCSHYKTNTLFYGKDYRLQILCRTHSAEQDSEKNLMHMLLDQVHGHGYGWLWTHIG